MVSDSSRKLVLASILLFAAWAPQVVQARGPVADTSALTVSLAELPRQGVETYHLIRQGGPFPHDKDGVVFGNRERLLPARKRGFYREYTVTTPGARDRGAKRIVCGGPPRTPENCYYSADHYASFRVIVP